jgi:RNA-directed DNA polymerase
MPRCFAAVVPCSNHIATAPTYATREATGPEPHGWLLLQVRAYLPPLISLGAFMAIFQHLPFIIVGVLLYVAFWALARWRFAPPKPVMRDLSNAAEPTDAEVKAEEIQMSGPLKASHRRLALRDPRLLPKPKPQHRQWPPPQKKRYMEEAEADRLFSATMRTRNRNIRDLATDEEQLKRYGLPVWRSEVDLAAALMLTPRQLQHLATHRHRDASSHYVTFAIPKRNGTQRLIQAPKRGLKTVLRRLDGALIARLPVSPYAHGFIKGRSVASNAAPHTARQVVIKFDIKDCFPTIHYGRVRGLFIALGYSYPVATALAVLMTEAPRQPVLLENKLYHVPVGPRVCVQGAPTSPGLCNAVLRKLDYRLAGLAMSQGFAFTRYADDLTFSGDDPKRIGNLRNAVAKIVAAEGFALNTEKTRIMRRGTRQSVTGVVVNEVAGLSRQERRKLRAAIHQLGKRANGDAAAERMRLAGKLAYLQMLNKAQAEPLQRQLAARMQG